MDPRFWKGRKVFVTGHTGFKGSWLCLWLQRLSADVAGYSLPAPTTPSLYEVADVSAAMDSIVGDVRDYRALSESIARHRPDVVFHLAAQSVVRLSYGDPVETYSTNVMGTVNLLEVMRHLSGRTAIVNVTSDKSYENKEWIWGYRETDRLGGHDPYSNSKACSELVSQAFADSFFSAAEEKEQSKFLATARAGNVIGGGDWTHDQLMPDVVQAFHEGRPVVLRHPDAVRPWQFVLDCLGGYMTLAERLLAEGRQYAGPWNFGPSPEDTLTVGALVERIIERWPAPASWVLDAGKHPHEAGTLQLDTSKAIQRLDWKPRLSVTESADWVVDWYARYFQGADAKSLCLEQIERFETKSSTACFA